VGKPKFDKFIPHVRTLHLHQPLTLYLIAKSIP
jgi:hypothetical protein